jgi:hypothetical protein
VFADTEGYLRSISYRYVLALAYRAFGVRWGSLWTRQDVEDAYRHELSGVEAAAGTVAPSFAAWAAIAGAIVKDGVEASRTRPDGEERELNYTAKMAETWDNVLRLAIERQLIV